MPNSPAFLYVELTDLPEHGLVVDKDRPTYEIYYKDSLEYCIPIR